MKEFTDFAEVWNAYYGQNNEWFSVRGQTCNTSHRLCVIYPMGGEEWLVDFWGGRNEVIKIGNYENRESAAEAARRFVEFLL